MNTHMTRPTGITILSIWNILGGLLLIVAGVLFLMFGPLIILGMVSKGEIPALLSLWGLKILNMLATGFIIFGIIALVVSYGLLKGHSWAWWCEIILCAVGIIYGLFTLILFHSLSRASILFISILLKTELSLFIINDSILFIFSLATTTILSTMERSPRASNLRAFLYE